ncbi:type VI secretion system baseplate subunit TssF [Rhodovulum sp. DZ06]|uniref:type VI secretion system baseplate subunit TssF n=1 Tax=Rhodovulum sp. DZ06 TaxID=3425126 RepID=UPI003D324A8B
MEEPLKTLYERELAHLDSHAREFAERRKFRQIAARLGLGDAVAVQDPFVEWLLEGFAYLAARVQHKLDQEFPRFSQNLLSVVYPHLSAPTPSMIVAELTPDHDDSGLIDGPLVRKGVELRAQSSGAGRKRVPFVTGRSVRLWPFRPPEMEYLSDRPAVVSRSETTVHAAETELRRRAALRVEEEGSHPLKVEAGLVMRLQISQDQPMSALVCDELDLFFAGRGRQPQSLFEACLMACPRVEAIIPPQARGEKPRVFPLRAEPLGFERAAHGDGLPVEDDALLPYDLRSYDGARLLHEFFSLPERFQFMRLSGLARAFAAAGEAREIEVVFALSSGFGPLKGLNGPGAVKLNCVPAVNLYEMSCDDIRLNLKKVEHHVLPDRAAPTDYEVHSVVSVEGWPAGGAAQEFRPFFSTSGFGARDDGSRRFYALSRAPRAEPVDSKGNAQLKQYRGDEVYVSLVDEAAVPFSPRLERLTVKARVTNRHLPLYVGGESATTQLTCAEDLGCTGIRIAAGPSLPRSGAPAGPRLWHIISHLSLNYLSLIDTENGGGDAAMRQLLSLYAPEDDRGALRLADAVRKVESRVISGRLHAPPDPAGRPQPIVFGRGLEVSITLDEAQERSPVLAAILDRFLAGYAAANSFTQVRVLDTKGHERCLWPRRSGTRATL